jgi:hypothetical protein
MVGVECAAVLEPRVGGSRVRVGENNQVIVRQAPINEAGETGGTGWRSVVGCPVGVWGDVGDCGGWSGLGGWSSSPCSAPQLRPWPIAQRASASGSASPFGLRQPRNGSLRAPSPTFSQRCQPNEAQKHTTEANAIQTRSCASLRPARQASSIGFPCPRHHAAAPSTSSWRP